MNTLRFYHLVVTLLSALAIGSVAQAKEGCDAPSPECAAVGEWDFSLSFGAGTRTNPLNGRDNIPLLLIPQLSYYGKRVFLDNLELGITLRERDSHAFNLIATPGYDRAFFFDEDPQNILVPLGFGPANTQVEVPHRSTTILVGPEWMLYRGRFVGQLAALHEVTGEHQGYEVRAAASMPLLEGASQLTASTGVTWKSTELVNYYYGVDGVYGGDSALNPFVKLVLVRPLSKRWTFRAYAHYEHLDGDIADSPFVEDAGVTTAFAGLVLKIF